MKGRARQQVVVSLIVGLVIVACWFALRTRDQPKPFDSAPPSIKQVASSSSLDASDRETALGLVRDRTAPLAGIPIAGNANLIRSPYAPEGPLIDVEGLALGTEIECPTTGKALRVPGDPRLAKVEENLDRLVFPKITLTDQTLAEAVAFLNDESATLDPDGKGVAFRVSDDVKEADLKSSQITLDLQNIPLREVVRYVADLSGLRLRTTGDGVELYPRPPLLTRQYEAPQLFDATVDPFLNEGVVHSKRPKSAKEILAELGVEFEE